MNICLTLVSLQILPKDLRHRLLNDSRRNQLVEVIMDLGRPPEARYLGEPGGQYLRNNEVKLIMMFVCVFNLLCVCVFKSGFL